MRTMIAFLLLSTAARAGDLIPTDARFGPLRVATHKVDVQIDNQIALTRVEQVFANDHPATLEAHYVFPVPKGASIIDFSMTVNGTLVRGELLEKEKARTIYEGIVRQSRDPGLLEHVGSNLFRVRVFPILANTQQKIEMTYIERVSYETGTCRFLYPLLCPGSAKSAKVDEFDFRWRMVSAVPIKEIACAALPVSISRQAEESAEVKFSGHQVELARDLEITYRIERPASGMDLIVNRPGTEDGTFMLLLTPKARAPRLPKDMTFVFDTSGSMEGPRLKQAKAALQFCLSRLQPDDRFNVFSFASIVTSFENEHVPATEEFKARAGRFVNAFDASGGTNINGALLRALEHQSADGRPHLILFLTDGEPTNGEVRPDQVVRNISSALRPGVRIFVFGVGGELNKGLLEDLADAGRGLVEFVDDRENIEEKISRLQKRVESPVLSDLSIDWGQAEVSALYPKMIGDLYAGTQLMVVGKYRKAGTFEITLRGRAGSKPVEIRQRLVFPERATVAPGVPYLWAMRRISNLLEDLRRHGENTEVVGEVIRLARQYRIATPYTSFLVLESEAAYEQRGIDRKGNEYVAPVPAVRGPDRRRFDTPVSPGDDGGDAEEPAIFFPQARESDHHESADNEDSHPLKGQSVFQSWMTSERIGTRSTRSAGARDSLALQLGGAQRYANVFGNPQSKVARTAQEIRELQEQKMAALFWLARHQAPDGSWSAEGFERQCAGARCEGKGDKDFDVGVTSLALLPFLGSGYSQLSKDEFTGPTGGSWKMKPGEVIKKGLQWLILQQDPEGAVGPRGAKYMYNHALATLVLCEAYGLTAAPVLKEPAQKAVDFLVASQNPGKGWRYSTRCGDADTSVTGWAMMALKSAELADLSFPKSSPEGVLSWIKEVTADEKGRFRVGYRPQAYCRAILGPDEAFDEHPTMTAAGILSRLFFQKNRKEPALAGAALLTEDPPDAKASKIDYNYWYFGSLALFQLDSTPGPLSAKWGASLGKALLPLQKAKPGACIDGSWDPVSKWGLEGGRVWATAINALTLIGCR